MRWWLLQILIALDQLANALAGGWADETLSSRAWRTERKGRAWGRITRPVIDAAALLFGDRDHCSRAFESERLQRQMPPEARNDAGQQAG